MKFTRNVPTIDGWYWVVIEREDGRTEPLPHVRIHGEWWFGMSRIDIYRSKKAVALFGDRIETPSMEVGDE